jgi:1-acyl-sn-glycerol-3-phosphate acyltransferase
MIKANKNRLIEKLFSVYNKSALKKHFNKVYIDGEHNFLNRSKNYPTIIYSNHSNWWDGLIAFYLSKSRWNIDAYLMMDEEQMKKYSFFKWIGAFSVNRSSASEAVKSLNYAGECLRNKSTVLWIYPQGIMQPNDYRPIKFYSGISRIAERLEGVNLIPIVLKYEFLLEQMPDVFIHIGSTKLHRNTEKIKDLTFELQSKLNSELDDLRARVISQKLDVFEVILQGKTSINKKIDKLYN